MRVLRYAQEKQITDYQTFTAMINEYYTDPDAVIDRVEDDVDPGVQTAT